MKTLLRGPVALWFLFAALASSLLAALPPAIPPQEFAQGYSDTTILAQPRANLDDATAESAETSEGLAVRQKFPRFGHLRLLSVPTGETALRTIKRLRATGRYAYVEPNRILHAYTTPNDPSFSVQWSLNNTGASSGTAGADIGAVAAWSTLSDASSVIVAIIDSGARLTHGDLAANLWSSTDSGHVGTHGISAIGGRGAISNYIPEDSDVGHGTHVSGIIGAVGNNGAGISGVAWKTQLMPLRYLHGTDGTGYLSDSLTCIQFAIDHGAKIINASYGSGSSSSSELTAIKAARDAGIIFVAAAGNGTDNDGIGVNNDVASNYPTDYAVDNIVSVAATTRTDALAGFSNFGSGTVDLGAPGQSIYSTYNGSDTDYQPDSGTSMAAPHVSGALALLRAKFPTDTYRQAINRLLRSATKISALNGKVQTGARLNLAAAITSTDNRPFNDDFSTRALVSGPRVRVRSSNLGATAESGEPAHAGTAASHTLWWSWTAPESSQVAFDTSGSAYDTVLAVYTGTAINALTAIASNDDATGTTTSRLLLDVTAGTTYQIAVDGKNGATGYTALKIGAVPANDNFAAARTLTGLNLRESGTTLNATRESGEPDPLNLVAGHSVWYQWVAPASGRYSLAVYASAIDTVVAVYTGGGLTSLVNVAANDDNANASNTDALATFTATAGTRYYFQVDHAKTDTTDGGDFVLTLTDSLWEFPANDEITSSPAAASDGTIYFGAGSSLANDTNVYAVNPDGSQKWSYTTTSTSNGVIGGGPAVGSDGTVYVGAYDGKLYALRSTGSLRWSYTTDSAIISTPAIGADGTVYVRNSTKLYALTSAGALKWTYTLNTTNSVGSYSYAAPVILADGSIIVGTTGGVLAALTDNTSSAATKWTYAATYDIFTTPAVGADGTIYFGTVDSFASTYTGAFYALTPGTSSATLKWIKPLADYTSTEDGSANGVTCSPALGADGTIYFAAYDHHLYALDPATGATKWTCTLANEVRASSPAIASDGTIYVGCYDGSVYAISSAGAIVRTYPSAKRVRSSPVIAGNRLYFGSADAKLHAFDLGQTNLASPWPMFHHDALRTGRTGSGAITLSALSSSKTVVAGSAVTLSVTATSTAALSYQWYKNGTAISGATAATYTVTSASDADAATYTVVLTTTAGSLTSDPITLKVVAAGTLPSTFSNIATRAYCSTGNNVTIGGFVVAGSASKRVLIRAVGPSLTAQGIGATEVLADPGIEVHANRNGTDTVVAANDNWTDNANATDLASTATSLGATAFLSSDTKSAALLTTLTPGVYSFVVTGKNNTSGIVLLEVYDADGASPVSTFANLAARADCTTGNGVAIGGFVISGTLPKTVLIRAVGPTLTTQGISTAEVLADPVIELHSVAQNNATIASNDNWTDNAAALRTAAARLGATPFDAADTKSAALLLTLQPGVYSFIASGKNSTTGIVLVEIYDAD